MLPSSKDTHGSLAEVVPSCFAAMDSETNPLGLNPTKSTLLVLIDGLGDLNLSAYSGHARSLWQHRRGHLMGIAPSTTAAALTSLTTGTLPGQHGIVGYRVRNPKTGKIHNQLRDWGLDMVPEQWQLQPTLMEKSRHQSFVISEPKHQDSGFTRAALRGAKYLAISEIDNRISRALELIHEADQRGEQIFCYLYISDLDQAAHKYGVGSETWLATLENIEQTLRNTIHDFPKEHGLLITSDHGVLNVSKEQQIILSRSDDLFRGVTAIGGEPRGLQLYLSSGSTRSDTEHLRSEWQNRFSDKAQIFTRDELQANQLFGKVSSLNLDRIGDLLIFAHKNFAFYSDDDLGGTKMIGQHGSLTETELLIPLITSGSFTPSSRN